MAKLYPFDTSQDFWLFEPSDGRSVIGLQISFFTQLGTLSPNCGHPLELDGGLIGY